MLKIIDEGILAFQNDMVTKAAAMTEEASMRPLIAPLRHLSSAQVVATGSTIGSAGPQHPTIYGNFLDIT